LVRQYFWLELDVRMALVHSFIANRAFVEHDPAISISHHFGFLVEFLLLWWQHSRCCETTLFGFLVEDRLFVFKTEQLTAVFKQCVKKVLVLGRLNESYESCRYQTARVCLRRAFLHPWRVVWFYMRFSRGDLTVHRPIVSFLTLPFLSQQVQLSVNWVLQHKCVLSFLLHIARLILSGVTCQ